MTNDESPAPRRNPRVESEHVEVGHATIQVSEADIRQSPASRKAARKLAWSLIVVFVVVIGLLTASFLFQNGQVHKVQRVSDQANANGVALIRQNAKLKQQLIADCGWYRDVSSLPVASPPLGKPSIIVPRLISDSRATWIGRGCPGKLPQPDPSFVKWATYYHLPVY